jgi:hypothetical protein
MVHHRAAESIGGGHVRGRRNLGAAPPGSPALSGACGVAGPPPRPLSEGAGGPKPAKECERSTPEAGFTGSVLHRARVALAVRCLRSGSGKCGCSYWCLPEATIEGSDRPDPAATDHTLHMREVQSMQSMQSMRDPSDGCRPWADPRRPGRFAPGTGSPKPAKEGERSAPEAGSTGSILRRAREDRAVRCVRLGFGKGGCSRWCLPGTAIDESDHPDPAAGDHTCHARKLPSMPSMPSMGGPSDGRRPWSVPPQTEAAPAGDGIASGGSAGLLPFLESGICRKDARAPVLAGLEIPEPSGDGSRPRVDTFVCAEISAPRIEATRLFLVRAGSRHHRPGLYRKGPKSSYGSVVNHPVPRSSIFG